MLYGILLTCYIFISFLLVILILIQQSKSSSGIGAFGGGAQMLFGGSGGQDLLQKTTWVLGALFMGLSLFLALMRAGYQPIPVKNKTMQPPIAERQEASQTQAESPTSNGSTE